MPRYTKTVVIDSKGRDKDKAFFITEQPSAQAEEWAFRVFMAMAKGGAQLPDNVQEQGFAGLMLMGLRSLLAGISFDDAKPLLDEMMSCVQVIPNPAQPQIMRPLIAEDIEEVTTRLRLRKEVFDLHTNFSETADDSNSPTTNPS